MRNWWIRRRRGPESPRFLYWADFVGGDAKTRTQSPTDAVLNGNCIELGEKALTRRLQQRHDNLVDQLRSCTLTFVFRIGSRERCPDNLAGTYLAPLARQFIAAVRATDTLEDARMNTRLQKSF